MTLPTQKEDHSCTTEEFYMYYDGYIAGMADTKKFVAKELRRIGEDTFNNYPDNPVEAFKFVAGELNKLQKELDGEKVTKDV
jgi:hypothetical protein